jgi:REP element-mobilizing transposase RayT
MIIGNGMPDHVHLFIGLRPTQSIADLMQEIKTSSSKWINQKKFVHGKFQWQDGYGAFSYSKSQLPSVVHYIYNQELHHKKHTFAEEYKMILDKLEIPYDERYIFEDIDQ